MAIVLQFFRVWHEDVDLGNGKTARHRREEYIGEGSIPDGQAFKLPAQGESWMTTQGPVTVNEVFDYQEESRMIFVDAEKAFWADFKAANEPEPPPPKAA